MHTASTCSIWESKADTNKQCLHCYIVNYYFRIRGHEPQSIVIGEKAMAEYGFLLQYIISNKLLIFQQKISFFHAFSFFCFLAIFCDWHTLHIVGRLNPQPATQLVFLLVIKQHNTLRANLGNWIKDCRRYGPSFALTSATSRNDSQEYYAIDLVACRVLHRSHARFANSY